MRPLSLMICIVVLCLEISVGFAACKPTTGGNTNSGSSVITSDSSVMNGEGAASTDSTVSTGNVSTDSASSVTGTTDATSSQAASVNLGDNVFVDDWD